MYDTLLDEFEDDTTRTSDDEENFPTTPIGEVVIDDDDNDQVEPDLDAEQRLKVKPDDDESFVPVHDNESVFQDRLLNSSAPVTSP